MDDSYYKIAVNNIGQCFKVLQYHTQEELKDFFLSITVKELRMLNNFYVVEFDDDKCTISNRDKSIGVFFDIWGD
jgi:hypothetical protein